MTTKIAIASIEDPATGRRLPCRAQRRKPPCVSYGGIACCDADYRRQGGLLLAPGIYECKWFGRGSGVGTLCCSKVPLGVEETADPLRYCRPVGAEPNEVAVGTTLDEFGVADGVG